MFLKKIQLKNKQRALNKRYAKEGLTDEILQKQVEINTKRHELDIPDENKKIHEDFVQ